MRFQRSLHRRQISFWSRQKFNVGQLRWDHADALETPLCASAGFERQEVLVAEMHGEFIKIRLEGDGRVSAEIIGFGARLIGELAKVRLRRSEEHTSELQSLTNIVCRLL